MLTGLSRRSTTGYYAAGASIQQIPDDKYFQSKLFFVSSNIRALNRVLGSKEKRDEVERLILLHGFERLISVRKIFMESKTWEDID